MLPSDTILSSFWKYLQFQKRYSDHTITSYKSDLNLFQKFLVNTYELEDLLVVQTTMIRSWVVQMLQNEDAPKSINRRISTLKTFYKFLFRNDYVQKNPTIGVVTPKIPKRLPKYVSQESLKRLNAAFDEMEGFIARRDELVIGILYATGMRRAELLQLSVEDIDFERQQLKVLGKGNKERLIPLGEEILNQLRRYILLRSDVYKVLSHTKLILTQQGKPAYPKLIYNIVKKHLSTVSTIEQKSPHVLRHSFATHLSNAGAPLNSIKELLGHANLSATQIYTHNTIEKLKKAYNKAHPKS